MGTPLLVGDPEILLTAVYCLGVLTVEVSVGRVRLGSVDVFL
jgi:hypothetical protein